MVEAELIAGNAASVSRYAAELQAGGGDPWWDYVTGYQSLLAGDVTEARLRSTRALDTAAAHGAPPQAPADLRARIAAMLAIIGAVSLPYPEMVEYGQIAVLERSTDLRVSSSAWFARAVGLGLAGRGGGGPGRARRGGYLARTGHPGGARDGGALDGPAPGRAPAPEGERRSRLPRRGAARRAGVIRRLGLSPDPQPDRLANLSGAEQRVALLVKDGMSNREIASTLFIQPGTVEFHLTNIYRKLGVSGRIALRKFLGPPQ